MVGHRPRGIGQLNERPLHAALKAWYAEPGDELEVPVDGYVIDIVRGELLIEIQTRSFTSIKAKLSDLLQRHRLHLVHPIALEKWLIKLPEEEEETPSRRKSPKRGRLEGVFSELVSFPRLMLDGKLTVEVLLTREEEVRKREPGRAWRRKGWVTQERRLIEVVERHAFEAPSDFAVLLPDTIPREFTTADLADEMSIPRRLAQQAAYCLRGMDVIAPVGKRGRGILYARADTGSE